MANTTTYVLRNRPLSFATAPRGWIETGSHPTFKHGTVTYAEPLSKADMEAYELLLVPSDADIDAFVAALVQAARENEYSPAENEPAEFYAVAGQAIDAAMIVADRVEITQRVWACLADDQIV